jgi:hypothetical protein
MCNCLGYFDCSLKSFRRSTAYSLIALPAWAATFWHIYYPGTYVKDCLVECLKNVYGETPIIWIQKRKIGMNIKGWSGRN